MSLLEVQSLKKIYTSRRGGTIPSRWQVVPVIMTGESELLI